jgi:hypothetical protein
VDAVLREGAPRVEIFDEPTLSSWDDRSTGAHAVSPVAAVKLFRRLRAAGVPAFTSPRITLVAYCVGERDFSHPPSPAGVHAGAEAVRTVLSACACP